MHPHHVPSLLQRETEAEESNRNHVPSMRAGWADELFGEHDDAVDVSGGQSTSNERRHESTSRSACTHPSAEPINSDPSTDTRRYEGVNEINVM
jgi:hypothetical protein